MLHGESTHAGCRGVTSAKCSSLVLRVLCHRESQPRQSKGSGISSGGLLHEVQGHRRFVSCKYWHICKWCGGNHAGVACWAMTRQEQSTGRAIGLPLFTLHAILYGNRSKNNTFRYLKLLLFTVYCHDHAKEMVTVDSHACNKQFSLSVYFPHTSGYQCVKVDTTMCPQ